MISVRCYVSLRPALFSLPYQTLAFVLAIPLITLWGLPPSVFGANQNQAIKADVLEDIGDETARIEEPYEENYEENYSPDPSSVSQGGLSTNESNYWRLDEGSEVIQLKAGSGNQPALFKKETTGNPAGALILIHDLNQNPDWPGPIRLLRRQLPNFGWTTLSLQIATPQPRAPTDALRATASSTTPEQISNLDLAKIKQAQQSLHQQVRSAFTFLNQKGLYNIVVIAQGVHASYTASQLKDVPPSSIAGFISLNMKPATLNETQKVAQHMSQIKAPILDLIPEITDQGGFAQSRVTMANQNAKQNYQQYVIPSTNQAFRGIDEFLIKRIRGWLKTNAGGMEAVLKSPQNMRR